MLAAVVAGGALAGTLLTSGPSSSAAARKLIGKEVKGLLAGIPQHARTLGSPTAPVTMQIFLDLKDPDCRFWLLVNLPPIVNHFVRPGVLKLEYRAYKTNTFQPQVFVKEQTAALAAGAQDKLWNFIETFLAEQGSEFRNYVTEAYLDGLARQVPGLNLTRWQADRHAGRREEQTTAEDQGARNLGLHVTPSFRIGKSGGPFRDYSGHAVVKYGEQHPIALPTVKDLGPVIKELEG